jgi:hypothetical protein
MDENRPLRIAAVELSQAALAARQGRDPGLDVERLAALVDVEARKLMVARREAVLTGLSRRASRAVAALNSIEAGMTENDPAQLLLELAAIAASLRLLGQAAAAPRAA